jgi:hypothetical protein
MSTRIETTHSRSRLLAELPASWAQAIVASPSRTDLGRAPAAVFTQLRRVLRDDGTLWLLGADRDLPSELARRGWLRRPVGWASPLRAAPFTRVHLFVKQDRYHYNSRAAELFQAARPRAVSAAGPNRCRESLPRQRRELLRRCILAGSSRTACGACGAPYTRTHQGTRPTCAHNDPRARCLVLDPFYQPATGTHEIAARHGRAFLGITGGDDR